MHRRRIKLESLIISSYPHALLVRYIHFGKHPSFNSSSSSSSSSSLVVNNKQPTHPLTVSNKIGIFWDLDNKPPKSVSPYEAAVKLKKAAASFGVVNYMVAYANRHSLSYVPPSVKEVRNERKVLNHLESKGVIRRVEPYLCRVCGRKFNANEKLVSHFKIHEEEHKKRVRQIEAAKGKKRVSLVGKYAVKMHKYESAARDVLIPKEGYGLAEDLKRAGFFVKAVDDKPQAVDVVLKRDIRYMMDHRRIQRLVLVSDDSDFVGVLKEAKERCLKTVVVGDNDDGVLKRSADASFSWREILVGKAKTQAVSVVGQWKDRDVLKRLEWSYDPEVEKDGYDWSDTSESEEFEADYEELVDSTENDDTSFHGKDNRPWWELDSDADAASLKPLK